MREELICAPSILAGDFARIAEGIRLSESAGADWIHLDVMDGAFVPEITFGAQMVRSVRGLTDLPLDVHLMVERPENHLRTFIDAGANLLTFHCEATVHSHRLVETIQSQGCQAGVALVPSASLSHIEELLPFVDLVLVMTVNPGYGGQKLILPCLDKVGRLDQLRQERGYSYKISIDGGVNLNTLEEVHKHPLDVLVTGTAFFGSPQPEKDLRRMKKRQL